MHLQIHQREAGQVTILELEGRLTLGEESDAMKEKFKNLLEASKNKIVVRLEKVIRVDSVGWGVVMHGVQTARDAGGDLHLLKPSRTVRQLLELLGLMLRPDLLRIFVDEQEALESFQPARPP